MSPRRIDNPVYGLAFLLCDLAFGRLYGWKVEGLEHVPESGRLLVACNHVSVWEPPALAWALSAKRIPWFLGKAELVNKPVLGWFLRKVHSIPLDRSKGDVAALRRAVEVLEGEGCLGVFPEGTRSRDGRPLKPKSGIGFLAAETGAPVVPVRVRGAELFPKRRGQSFRFGPPLRFGEGEGEVPGREGYRLFAERVMAAVFKL